MDVLEAIKSRRSVRSYQPDKPVPPEAVQEILACGHAAPTGGNIQPWEFIVVTDAGLRQKIMETTYRGNSFDLSNHQTWIADAPVLIVVLGNRSQIAARYGQKEAAAAIYMDCSACIENMLLAALSFGLGACYISGFFEKLLASLLKVPATHQVVGFVTLGYAKGQVVQKPKEPLAAKVSYEYYGQGGNS